MWQTIAKCWPTILGWATLLGGMAAVGFFWDKIWEWIQRGSGLEFKLEQVHIGHETAPDGYRPGISTRIRVTNQGSTNRSVVHLEIHEEGGPVWRVQGYSYPGSESLVLPLNVPPHTALPFCLQVCSPAVISAVPIIVGRLRLEAEDHTSKHYQLWLTAGPTQAA